MKLSKRHWYATYLLATFLGSVVGMTVVPPAVAGNSWVDRYYAFQVQHVVLLSIVVLVALLAYAFKKRPIGPSGWPLCFGIGYCIAKILYARH